MTALETIGVLLIEDDPDFAELVRFWLDGENKSFSVVWRDSLAGGLLRLNEGGIDVILLDLGLGDSDGAATLLTLLEQVPTIPVIILSANGGEALALQMIRESAEDYLVKSSCNVEVITRSIRYALSRHGSRKERSAPSYGAKPAKIVGIIGAKGGVGTTTVAWSFAADLGQQTGEKVLICDFDFDTGMIAFLAGVSPDHSVEDATENIGRLDQTFWQKIVEQAPNGIDILAAPRFYPSAKPDAKTIGELLAKVRRFYGWIVLDLGRQNREATLLCERVDELLLVTTTAIPSLYEAKRFYDNMPQTAIDRDRIRLIVNELDKGQQISSGDLSTLFGNPVCGLLPPDAAELNKAAIERRLPRESSSFRKEMLRIARRVANLPEAKPKHSASEFFFGKGQAKGEQG